MAERLVVPLVEGSNGLLERRGEDLRVAPVFEKPPLCPVDAGVNEITSASSKRDDAVNGQPARSEVSDRLQDHPWVIGADASAKFQNTRVVAVQEGDHFRDSEAYAKYD